MKPSQSHILQVRGLRYHVRTWGDERNPKLVLLHGWMDVSASFQFLVDALQRDWYVIAPDWRGFGLSEWASGGYWFPDYIADLEVLLQQAVARRAGRTWWATAWAATSPGCTPASVRAASPSWRCSKGSGCRARSPAAAPERYDKWLEEIAQPPSFKPYASFEEVEARLLQNNRRLSRERARFLAPHWAKRLESGGSGAATAIRRTRWSTRCCTGWRKRWRAGSEITAPVLWVWGDGQWMRQWLKDNAADLEERRAAFRQPHRTHHRRCRTHDAPRSAGTLAETLEAFLSGRADRIR